MQNKTHIPVALSPESCQSGQRSADSEHAYAIGEIALAFDPDWNGPFIREERGLLRWMISDRAAFVFIVEGPFRTTNDVFYRTLVMREELPPGLDKLEEDEVFASRFNPHRIARLWAEFPVSQDQLILVKSELQPSQYYKRKVLRARESYRKGTLPSPVADEEGSDFLRNFLIKKIVWLTSIVDRRRLALEAK